MSTAISDDDVTLARNWASLYRLRGFQVLPSDPEKKKPLVRYSQWWDEPVPEDLVEQFRTPNLQIICGRRWRLLVLDIDGDEAKGWLATLPQPLPRTWATHSGGDGLHLWFRLPGGVRRPLPKAVLWKGPNPHSAVERLCDRSLIMAPPSIHPGTKERYRFVSKAQSPIAMPLPADCPPWVLGLPVVEAAPRSLPMVADRPAPHRVAASSRRFAGSDVLAAIPDKLAVAQTWGLRIASHRPNHAGWCSCHAIGREDRTPSASISAETGRYWEAGEPSITFFELAVRLGAYLDRRDAVADLGRLFGAKEVA